MIAALALVALTAGEVAGPSRSVGPGPQAGEPRAVRCVRCRNLGRQPCPEHPSAESELEDGVLYCSFVGLCGTCGGGAWLDCPRCENPAVEEALRSKRSGAPALAQGLRVYEREMGRSLSIAESPHFVLVCELEERKIGRERISPHRLLHLYVERLEALYADYTSLFAIAESGFERKSEILIWESMADHREAGLRFCSYVAPDGVYHRGEAAIYSVCGSRLLFRTDELLHRNVVHHAVHGLASHQSPSRWLGNIGAGWADAGLAHWFEDRFFGVCDNFCYQEGRTHLPLPRGAWRPLLREAVASGEAPALSGLLGVNTDALTPLQHVTAFGLVDYLIAQDASKMNALLAALRARTASRDALREVFGVRPIELQESFEAWVLATYPTRR